MPRRALTDRFVSGAKEPGTIFDTRTTGLALRVNAKSKTWFFVYRVRGGASQWLLLGTYPGIKLIDARKLVHTHRRAVDEGRDPAAERREAERKAKEPPPPPPPVPTVFTFNDLVALYKTFAKGRKKTWDGDLQKINRYLVPAWGPMAVTDITREQIHDLLDSVQAKGLTVGVNRVQAVISRLFTVALDRNKVKAHPAARMMKRFKEQPGDRVLTDDELRALWGALDARPGRASDALRLRLLLGQRGSEITDMLWTEVDLVTATWDIPANRTKNGRPHMVPLTTGALDVLKRRRDEVPTNEPRVFPQLTVRSDDYRDLSSIHGGAYEWKDLRRTLGTRLAALGFSETIRGRVLNHARTSVTSKHYDRHEYATEKRQALDAWDRELHRIIEQREAARADVVPFTRGR